jgi:hypothetical protein
MTGLGRAFFRGAIALAMASGIWLGGQGTALAVECSDKLDANWPDATLPNPGADDRQAIMDLISTYYWILDARSGEGQFENLFTSDSKYEACRAGGQVQLVTIDKAALITRTKGIFDELTKNGLQIRHMVSNVLLRDTGKNDVVEGKFTLLVLLQRAVSTDVPEFDYVASVKAKFKKDNEKWKFLSLTLITDTPDVEERAR